LIIFKKEGESDETKDQMGTVETQMVDFLLFKIGLYIYVSAGFYPGFKIFESL
jgi:hypothetical protein